MPPSDNHYAHRPRKILIVAYFYPPLNSIGARRPHALAKWLRRLGHDVTVLTSKQSGLDPADAADQVLRAPDLLATRLNWRGQSLAAATGRIDAPWNPDRGLWGSIVVPDIQLVSWVPFAIAKALRAHRRIGFDAVITTSPVESAHAIGLALKRLGVTWIADLRDGWRFEAPREDWPFGPQRKLDALLEHSTLKRADRIVTVSEPLSIDLRIRRRLSVETITNGFDPDDVAQADGIEAPLDPDKFTLVHTGGLGRKQSLLPLLEALARIENEGPTTPGHIELVLAGQRTTEQQELHARPEFSRFLRYVGFVDRPTALALQRKADLLVLVTSGLRRGEATGKLFEYLAAQRPILLFGTNNTAAEILASTGAGVAIETDDSQTAEIVIRQALAQALPGPQASAIEAYGYQELARRYNQLIEQAISRI